MKDLLKKLWVILNTRWEICYKCKQNTDLFWPVIIWGYSISDVGYICDKCIDIELNKEVLPMTLKRSPNE
jgi:hypothetical protein